MSLLAEEVVEEWLNRNGYFTIRGIKVGNNEIDILAIKPMLDRQHECRHIEVTVSIKPMAYITAKGARRRSVAQLTQEVHEWIEGKFNQQRKIKLKQSLCSGPWTRELVIGKVRYEQEIDLLRQGGITVHRLNEILLEMVERPTLIKSATGANLFDLIQLPYRSMSGKTGTGTATGKINDSK